VSAHPQVPIPWTLAPHSDADTSRAVIWIACALLALACISCAASIPHRYPALNTSGVSRGDSLWAVDSRDNKWRMCYVDSTWRIRFTGRGYGKLPAGAVK